MITGLSYQSKCQKKQKNGHFAEFSIKELYHQGSVNIVTI